MEFVIWVETRIADRTVEPHKVAKIERPTSLRAMQEIGLTLQDGKTIIKKVQRGVVICSSRSKANLELGVTLGDQEFADTKSAYCFRCNAGLLLSIPSLRLPTRRGRRCAAKVLGELLLMQESNVAQNSVHRTWARSGRPK